MAEDPVETDAVMPEAPVPDPPPHVPGQVSATAQQGTSAAVPPAGGPNDTNTHQAPAAAKGGTPEGNTAQDSQPSVRPSNYKTRLCMKWQQQGECTFGARCNFAHGIEEMRSHQHEPSPFLQQRGWNGGNKVVNENRKTRLCTKWHQYGVCPYADKCNFAHGVHELKNPPGMMHDMNGNGPHPASARNNYKTRICLNWQNTGQCTYASRCNFAHGVHELRGGGGKGEKRGIGMPSQRMQQEAHAQSHQQGQGGYPGAQMGSYGLISIAQMPFHPMHAGGDMGGFQGPVVPMGAGMMPIGMPAGLPPPGMEHFGQPGGYMPQLQLHPAFAAVPASMAGMAANLMQPYPTPSPGPVAPPLGTGIGLGQDPEMVVDPLPEQPQPQQA